MCYQVCYFSLKYCGMPSCFHDLTTQISALLHPCQANILQKSFEIKRLGGDGNIEPAKVLTQLCCVLWSISVAAPVWCLMTYSVYLNKSHSALCWHFKCHYLNQNTLTHYPKNANTLDVSDYTHKHLYLAVLKTRLFAPSVCPRTKVRWHRG